MKGKIAIYIIMTILLCMGVLSHLYYGWQSYFLQKPIPNEYLSTYTSEEYGSYLMNFYQVLDDDINDHLANLPSQIDQFVIYQDQYTLKPLAFGKTPELTIDDLSYFFAPWLIVEHIETGNLSLEDTVWYLPTDGSYPQGLGEENMSGLFTIEQLIQMSFQQDKTALNMLSRILSGRSSTVQDQYMIQALSLSPDLPIKWLDFLRNKQTNHPLYADLLEYYQRQFDLGWFLKTQEYLMFIQPVSYKAFQGLVITFNESREEDQYIESSLQKYSLLMKQSIETILATYDFIDDDTAFIQ